MTHIFNLIFTNEFTSLDSTLVTLKHGTRLRKVDENGNAAVSEGKYGSEGIAVTRELKATGNTGFLGFEADAEIPSGTQLLFALSNDGGTTFYWYDSGAWVASTGPNDFNDPTTVDANIETFPVGIKRYVVKIKFVANTNRTATPRLQKVLFHYNVRYNWVEDVKRSVKRYLDNNFRVPLEVAQILSSTTDKVIVNSNFSVETVEGVFNLSVDPGRTTDLFQSSAVVQIGADKDGTPVYGTEITMSSAQANGNIIEVQFLGSSKVYIGQADSDIKVTELPAIVVVIDAANKRMPLKSGTKNVERNLANKRAFKREPETEMNVPVTLRCLSSLEEASLAMVHEMQRVFDTDVVDIKSEATGEIYSVLDFAPFTAADVTADSLAIKDVNLTLFARFWAGDAVQLPIAEILGINVEYPYVFDATIVAKESGRLNSEVANAINEEKGETG